MHFSILLGQLIHFLGEIRGRKKLQKIVYLLQCQGAPFREDFEYSHFGPYSPGLKVEVDVLTESELLTETPGAGSIGYVFRPGSAVKDLQDNGFLESEPSWIALAKQLNQQEPKFLEAVSTIFFLKNVGIEADCIEKRFGELKPHLASQFAEAFDYALRLPRVAA